MQEKERGADKGSKALLRERQEQPVKEAAVQDMDEKIDPVLPKYGTGEKLLIEKKSQEDQEAPGRKSKDRGQASASEGLVEDYAAEIVELVGALKRRRVGRDGKKRQKQEIQNDVTLLPFHISPPVRTRGCRPLR